MKISSFYGKLTLIFLVFVLALSCTKNTKDDNTNNNNNNNSTSNQNEIDKKYLREGFVEQDTFRIVIVSAREDSSSDSDAIKDKAKKRALATLKKLIISKDRKYDSNVRADLINLINSKGDFYKKDIDSRNNNVFYLDVKKSGLKRYIKKISSERK